MAVILRQTREEAEEMAGAIAGLQPELEVEVRWVTSEKAWALVIGGNLVGVILGKP